MSVLDKLEQRYFEKLKRELTVDWTSFQQLLNSLSTLEKDTLVKAVEEDNAGRIAAIFSTRIDRYLRNKAQTKRAEIEASWPQSVIDTLNELIGD